uniref:Uncharacterized protein n=1 Tax=Arundo donax TaxID=35708 RepID=A0A0A8ZXP0_ARUDO
MMSTTFNMYRVPYLRGISTGTMHGSDIVNNMGMLRKSH